MEVRPIGKHLLGEAEAILTESYWNYPEVVHLLPDEKRRRRVLPRYLTVDMPWALTIAREVLRSQEVKDAGHTHAPHIYLCEIDVSPKAQGTGAGSALVEAMTEQPEQAHVSCYLTTSNEANTAWYHRFGFKVTEEFHPTPS